MDELESIRSSLLDVQVIVDTSTSSSRMKQLCDGALGHDLLSQKVHDFLVTWDSSSKDLLGAIEVLVASLEMIETEFEKTDRNLELSLSGESN